MTSYIECLAVIIAALSTMEKNGNLLWQPLNDEQSKLVNYYVQYKDALANFSDKELEALCSNEPGPVNDLMQKHNFDIQLEREQGDNYLYLGAVAKAHLKWIAAGESKDIFYQQHPGVKQDNAGAWRVVEYSNPASLESKILVLELVASDSRQKMLLVPAQEMALFSRFELLEFLAHLKRGSDVTAEYEYAHFPMISLEYDNDCQWLLGLQATQADSLLKVIKAFQKTRLAVNENEARAESACAITVMATCFRYPKPPFIIDKPFYVVITDERLGADEENIGMPFFYGYCNSSCWKRPE